MKNHINNQELITVISHIVEHNLIEGTESLVYYVANQDDEYGWGIQLGCKKFWTREKAYQYAVWLHDKFNTLDIVDYES